MIKTLQCVPAAVRTPNSFIWPTRPHGLTCFLNLSSLRSATFFALERDPLACFRFLEFHAPSSLGAFVHTFPSSQITPPIALSLFASLIAADPSVLSVRALILVKAPLSPVLVASGSRPCEWSPQLVAPLSSGCLFAPRLSAHLTEAHESRGCVRFAYFIPSADQRTEHPESSQEVQVDRTPGCFCRTAADLFGPGAP